MDMRRGAQAISDLLVAVKAGCEACADRAVLRCVRPPFLAGEPFGCRASAVRSEAKTRRVLFGSVGKEDKNERMTQDGSNVQHDMRTVQMSKVNKD